MEDATEESDLDRVLAIEVAAEIRARRRRVRAIDLQTGDQRRSPSGTFWKPRKKVPAAGGRGAIRWLRSARTSTTVGPVGPIMTTLFHRRHTSILRAAAEQGVDGSGRPQADRSPDAAIEAA